jgi:hypothetical protein
MKVVGSDGEQVGMVDRVEGKPIKLIRDSDGEHHFLGTHLVDRVAKDSVTLSIPAAEAHAWSEH